MTFSLSAFSAYRNIIPLFLLILFSFAMERAQAITINFDDLNPEDFINVEDPEQGPIPLTDEYASLGVMFVDGAYLGSASPNFSPNFVNGPGFSFYFLGRLPQYVSFYAGSLARWLADWVQSRNYRLWSEWLFGLFSY